MSLLITHVLISIFLFALIIFLFWYNKQLRLNDSNLKKYWMKRSKTQYNFMKYASMFMVFAFALMLLSNVAKIIVIMNS